MQNSLYLQTNLHVTDVNDYRGMGFLAKLLWKRSEGLGHFGIAYQTGTVVD